MSTRRNTPKPAYTAASQTNRTLTGSVQRQSIQHSYNDRIEGLTRYGQMIHLKMRVSKENVGKHNCLDIVSSPYPSQSLLKLHPVTNLYLERATEFITDDSLDERWSDDRVLRRDYADDRTFYVNLITEVFESVDFCWDQYLSFIDRWGVMAGHYWKFSKTNLIGVLWDEFPESKQIAIEDVVMERIGMSDEYPKRGTREFHTFKQIECWVLDLYHDRIIRDLELTQKVLEATESGLEIRYCSVCGTEYQRLQLAHLLPDTLLAIGDCCLGCPLHESFEQDLPHLMRNFVEACGFIPESGLVFESPAFLSRLERERLLVTARAYCDLGGFSYISTKYESWIKALLMSGVLGDRGRLTKRGIVCLADDGDVCNSLEPVMNLVDFHHGNETPQTVPI